MPSNISQQQRRLDNVIARRTAFAKRERRVELLIGCFGLFIIGLSVTLIATLIFVAFHFLLKFW